MRTFEQSEKGIKSKMSLKIKKMLQLELGILFLVLIIFIIARTKLIYLMPNCLFNTYFGILCPSCGGTRCVINLLHGNFVQSFLYHPVFFITIIYLMLVNILYIINSFRKREVLTFLYPKTKFWIIFTIIILIFTICRNL